MIRKTAAVCMAFIIIPLSFFLLLPWDTTIFRDVSFRAAALDTNEQVVTTFDQLHDALAYDNGITTVYLGADITMTSSGINIDDHKTNVEIVGLNPLTPERTEPYTLTDHSSATFTHTIYINSTGVKNVLVRDIKITGKNYYGPVSAVASAITDGLTITFQRVVYNGPQIGHNRYGIVRFSDCDITITGDNGGSVSQEAVEAKHVYFEGANTIHSESSVYSIIWISGGGGTFTLLEDASLAVTSPNTSVTYGVFHAAAPLNKITIALMPRSVFTLSISAAFVPTAYGTLDRMTVGKDAKFILNTTKAAAAAVFSMGGDLLVEENAWFIINGFSGGLYSVLNQRDGNIDVEKNAVFHITAQNTYANLINLYGKEFRLNDPASVLLYNPGGRDIVATTSPGRIFVSASQINLWNVAGPGGFDDLPLYSFTKADRSNMVIDAVLAYGPNGNISTISSNHVPGDIPTAPPSASTFNMNSARVLAFGRLPLTVDIHFGTPGSITGTTTPRASVIAKFTQDDVGYTSPPVVSGSAGDYEIPVGVSLAKDTAITVHSTYNYLFATETLSVGGEATLEISIPEVMTFTPAEIMSPPQWLRRQDDDWHIQVVDTRGENSRWSLYARLLTPLTPAEEGLPLLPDAIVFVDEDGIAQPLSLTGGTRIHEHTATSDQDRVRIEWATDRGILVQMPSAAVYSNRPYTAVIEWSLIDAP